MITQLKLLRKATQAKNSGNLGDFAILKAEALGAKVDAALKTTEIHRIDELKTELGLSVST